MSVAVALPTQTTIVLVVEDDRQARELFRTALRAEGYKVVAVEDGLDALKFLEAETPAAVVLDLGLPRLHGGDVLREMESMGLTHSVPVIVVTGESRPVLNELDFACVLRKPIGAEELIAAVRGCIAKARSHPPQF